MAKEDRPAATAPVAKETASPVAPVKVEEKKPPEILPANVLYAREQAQAASRWKESREKRAKEEALRKRYAIFAYIDPSNVAAICVGDHSQKGKKPRMVEPMEWLFVSESELDELTMYQKRGVCGVVALPEGVEPSKVSTDKG